MKNTKNTNGKAQASAQDWLPIDDIADGFLHRSDGALIGGVRIWPLSLELRSAAEVRKLVRGYQRVIAGLAMPWQVVSLPKPVDLEWHLLQLGEQAAQLRGRRAQLALDYRAWLADRVRSGRSTERLFALLCVFENDQGLGAAQRHHLLVSMARDLHDAGIEARVLSDDDWRELLWLTFNGRRAAIEPPPRLLGVIPPRYEEPVDTGQVAGAIAPDPEEEQDRAAAPSVSA